MPELATSLALIAGGGVLLVLGGNLLVKHAARLAESYHVPKTVIGAVIVGFGTSLPELFVSLTAAVDGSPGIAIGNVVGSNIANIGLILGLGAFLATLHVERRLVRTDLPLGVLAVIFLMVWAGPELQVSRLAGGILTCGFVGYLWLSLHHTKQFRLTTPKNHDVDKTLALDLFWVVVGLAFVTLGARALVSGATDMARLLDVSERVIGLSMVALSTSLPELAAVYAAARKGEADLAVGNIAGSNLFNLLGVLGITSLVHPVPVENVMVVRDFPILAAFSVLAFPLMATARRMSRVQGGILLAGYFVYIGWTWSAG